MNTYMTIALTIFMVASTIGALDSNALVEEATNDQANALAEMLIQRGGRAIVENEVSKLAPELSPTFGLFQEVPEDMIEIGGSSGTVIEKKAALAGAHVEEDKASLLLSGDAQELEQLRGQMSLKVLKAKAQIAAKSGKGPATAKQAAALAKQVVAKTKKVKEDEAKEGKAKDKVKKMQDLLEAPPPPPPIAIDKINISALGHSSSGGSNNGSWRTKDAEDIDANAAGDGPKNSADPISMALLGERKKYSALERAERANVENAKHKVAKLETSVQTLSDNLAKAKKDLTETSASLQQHLRKHSINQQLYEKITAKELHHKKMSKLKEQIQRQEDMLKVQSMKIKASKEQLHKSLIQKQGLTEEAPKGKLGDWHTARTQEGASASQQQPAVQRAVAAVSKNLQSQDLEAEMQPQIAKFKATLHGAALRKAIDKLVSDTVANKVDNAFTADPNVKQAVHSVVGSVRTQAASKSAAQAQAEAQRGISAAVQAGHDLDVADTQFGGQSKLSPAEEDLEAALQEID